MQPTRKNLRLQQYDYTQEGFYFITIVTKDRTQLYGTITNQIMHPTLAGELVQKWWYELVKKFANISLDEFVLMPNHIHGLIEIVKKSDCSISKIIQWYKTMTTNDYLRQVKTNGWEPCNKKLWQRGYYEHIIRNDESLNQIREYIINNPINWIQDELF